MKDEKGCSAAIAVLVGSNAKVGYEHFAVAIGDTEFI